MTAPASAIPGPQASAPDVTPAPPKSFAVSRTFLVNLQYLSLCEDPYDLVRFAIRLMVEIAQNEERLTEAVKASDDGWRDAVVTARTARDQADRVVEQLRAHLRVLAVQSTASPATLHGEIGRNLIDLAMAIEGHHNIGDDSVSMLRTLGQIFHAAQETSMGLVQIGGHPSRYRFVEEIRLDG